MDNKVGDVSSVATSVEANVVSKTATPSRKRYSRAQLMNFRDTLDLTAPPNGYNPATLKPAEPLNKDMPQSQRDGQKWNRTRSMNWAGQNQGNALNLIRDRFQNYDSVGPKGGMLPQFNRTIDGPDDMPGGPGRGGRALRSAISWSEAQHQQQSGAIPVPDKNFGRRNSRSDAPGRWDNNKDEQLSKSSEKRGPEKWMSYGHRDARDKSSKDECIENPPQEMPYQGNEPEWMHSKPTTDSAERMKQQRQFAADIEEERKMMREKLSKQPRDRSDHRVDQQELMTEEEIDDFKKQLEAEERGCFTFDSLKEAMKSQGVSNLPPMPTTGISTVDQIEKSMKASAQLQRPSAIDADKQRFDILKLAGQQQSNLQSAGLNLEGANRLLSLLKRQGQPGGSLQPVMAPPSQMTQPLAGGFPLNIPQQQGGMLQGSNVELQRLFAANQRAPGNIGMPTYGGQPQVPPSMGNMASLPYMHQQAAAQFNQRGGPQQHHNIIATLLANQQAQQAAARQKAQMMARLQQAQQQTPLQHPRADPDSMIGHDTAEDENEMRGKTEKPVLPTSMMGMFSGTAGPVQNQIPQNSFGLQGNLMANRSAIPAPQGVFNSSTGNLQMGGNPQDSLFPGGLGPGTGLGGHPGFLMQNGGGLARPVGPGLTGMNLSPVRPGMGAPNLGSRIDDRQLQFLNGQPNTLPASLLAAQQNNAGGVSSGLNRFFGENNMGAPGGFPTEQPAVAPVRNRSLEELKNEAQ